MTERESRMTAQSLISIIEEKKFSSDEYLDDIPTKCFINSQFAFEAIEKLFKSWDKPGLYISSYSAPFQGRVGISIYYQSASSEIARFEWTPWFIASVEAVEKNEEFFFHCMIDKRDFSRNSPGVFAFLTKENTGLISFNQQTCHVFFYNSDLEHSIVLFNDLKNSGYESFEINSTTFNALVKNYQITSKTEEQCKKQEVLPHSRISETTNHLRHKGESNQTPPASLDEGVGRSGPLLTVEYNKLTNPQGNRRWRSSSTNLNCMGRK